MHRILSSAAAVCLGGTLSLLLGACVASGAQHASASGTVTGPDNLAEVDVPYQRFVLSNGLTVLIHEDHKAPLVAIDIWYHVGSKDEPAGRHGFAHLFEHLMFTGSQHYDDEYFRALEPAGAVDINGTTNDDRTNFFETVPTSALTRALWLESDRMGYLAQAITESKLDQQREVVENEKRQDENQPYGKVDDIIARESYPVGHPYSWTTIGSEADLDAASLADVRNWFSAYYGPSNAVLVLAGDVDTKTVEQEVERDFGSLPPGPPVAHIKAWPAPLVADKRVAIQDQVPLPRVYLVWNVPGDGDRDNVLLDLLASVLSDGNGGRLFERLVYRDQTVSSVSVGLADNEIGGQFQIVATVKPGGDLVAVEGAIREELDRVLKDGPGNAELARIKAANNAAATRGLDKVGGSSGKAGLLASNQTFHGDPAHYKIELGWQRNATPDDVRAAARRWLGSSLGSLTLQVQPEADLKPGVSEARAAQLPALLNAPALRLPPIEHATLSNGLKIYFAERHAVPVVEMQMLFNAGRAADAGGRSGVAALTFDMLNQGAGKLDSLAIARRENELGASLSFGTQRDLSAAGISAMKPRLGESLDLFTSVLRDAQFPEDELARLKSRLLSAIAREKAQPFGAARRVLSRLLFGEGHPYAYAGVGLPADVKAITRADLVAFRQRWMRPDNATLVVVGDTTLAEIQPLLEERFGSWAAPDSPVSQKNVPAVPLPPASRVYLIDKPGADQSLVLASNLAPPASDPDDEAMETVDTALGGMFISRLNLNLRQAKHWSYGAGSFLSASRGQQVFGATAQVETGHTAEAAAEMLRELQGISGQKPLTGTEIAAAKDAQVLALPGSFESTPEVAGAIDTLVELGLPDNYWNALVPRVQALTPAQLQAAATKLVKPENLTWVIVGDLATIEASVRRLKLGEVTVLDADGVKLR